MSVGRPSVDTSLCAFLRQVFDVNLGRSNARLRLSNDRTAGVRNAAQNTPLARRSDFQLQAVGIFDKNGGELTRVVAILAQNLCAFFSEFLGDLLDVVGDIA